MPTLPPLPVVPPIPRPPVATTLDAILPRIAVLMQVGPTGGWVARAVAVGNGPHAYAKGATPLEACNNAINLGR